LACCWRSTSCHVYYDLDLSLLIKSSILMAVGVALLAAYAVLRRTGAAAP
jgi:uncharacterized membrane protein